MCVVITSVVIYAFIQWVPVDIPPSTPTPRSAVGASARAEKPNQFAPQGINPAELKEKVKAVRAVSDVLVHCARLLYFNYV